MRAVEIARLGRADGQQAFVRTGGGPPVSAVGTAWLSGHVHRLPTPTAQRVYLFAFQAAYTAAAQPATTEE